MVALVALHAFEALAVAAAMPTVAEALDGLRLYALAFGGTLATSVIGMTLAGRWADRRGPARPLWYGLACFVLGLLLAGFAVRMGMLVAGRLMQGLGAGAISVSLYVMVGRSYPEHLRPKVFAAFSAGWVVPSMVGPALSGLIVQHLGWRWVFWRCRCWQSLLPCCCGLRWRACSPPPTATTTRDAATSCVGPVVHRWRRCCCTSAASSMVRPPCSASAWRCWRCCYACIACCRPER